MNGRLSRNQKLIAVLSAIAVVLILAGCYFFILHPQKVELDKRKSGTENRRDASKTIKYPVESKKCHDLCEHGQLAKTDSRQTALGTVYPRY